MSTAQESSYAKVWTNKESKGSSLPAPLSPEQAKFMEVSTQLIKSYQQWELSQLQVISELFREALTVGLPPDEDQLAWNKVLE